MAAMACTTIMAADLEGWTGGPAPRLEARTLSGERFDLAASRGRTVLVNFWATWCAPCVAEMPGLQRLRDRLAAERLEVITIDYQENPARIRSFLEQHQLTLPVVRDHDGSLRTAWRVNVFPSTFVIAPDGRIAWAAAGEVDWDDAAVIARVRSLR
jgi:thiol-disulfide isomerase/thioredoxin